MDYERSQPVKIICNARETPTFKVYLPNRWHQTNYAREKRKIGKSKVSNQGDMYNAVVRGQSGL
jgi:hypothetical protein